MNMKRLLILPAFLLIFALSPASAQEVDSDQGAQRHIKTGISYYESGQNKVYANQTKLDEAIEEFTKALHLDPNSAEARYYLGLTCLAMDSVRCAEEQYQFLKGLNAAMAEKLWVHIEVYRTPARFEHVGTRGETWKPPVEEKAPAINTPAPEASTDSKDKKSCEVVSFSTYKVPGKMAQFAQGGTIYEEPRLCVTATIRNSAKEKASAKDFMIVAHFSDGDTMQARIDSGVSGMSEVKPGETVTGSACFKKEKATIAKVQCGKW